MISGHYTILGLYSNGSRPRKHEDSSGEISTRRPSVSEHLGQDGGIGGGSHRLEGVTSHQERVRPVKERVGSSACNSDGEGGTNDVCASRILSSRLGCPGRFGCSPVGQTVRDEPLEEGNRIRVRVSASLKRD